MTKLTIGIPCYNHEEYIAEAIESALAQTVPCEVIVVDDGSRDRSAEIIAEYPVKLVRQVNKGLPSARNTLVMNMTGDYLLPLDADDILLENCAKRVIQVIEETGADVVSPSFKTFGLHNEPMILMPEPKLVDFYTGNRVAYCSAIKKDALLEVGGYSPRMVWGYEDLHLWYNLLSRGKRIVTIPEILWLYRTKEVSMITESVKHHDELMAIINKDFPHD